MSHLSPPHCPSGTHSSLQPSYPHRSVALPVVGLWAGDRLRGPSVTHFVAGLSIQAGGGHMAGPIPTAAGEEDEVTGEGLIFLDHDNIPDLQRQMDSAHLSPVGQACAYLQTGSCLLHHTQTMVAQGRFPGQSRLDSGLPCVRVDIPQEDCQGECRQEPQGDCKVTVKVDVHMLWGDCQGGCKWASGEQTISQ